MNTGEPAATMVDMHGTSSAAAPRKDGGLPVLLRSGAGGLRRSLAIIDLVLRVAAFGTTLAAAIATATSDERLNVFTQFFQFHARFDDFPAFTYVYIYIYIPPGLHAAPSSLSLLSN
jgi:hypothetical protein